MATVNILAAVNPLKSTQYQTMFKTHSDFDVQYVDSVDDILVGLNDRNRRIDILIADYAIDGAFEIVSTIRQTYPRLLMILVDEEADFGLPGIADDMTTAPFENDDLINRIQRLIADRNLETLRSDSLPAIRNITKTLKTETTISGKLEAAINICKEMGFDYVAYYSLETDDPIKLRLSTHKGPDQICTIAPKQVGKDDLVGWVIEYKQSRVAGPTDDPNHPLVTHGMMGTVVCTPVHYNKNSYGVISALHSQHNKPINQNEVMLLELVATQLAVALYKM